ncbi:MAG: major facilitator superfamily 1 [Marmoricola sp.]|nr:major facilitator superfamily 1 [Marmoricola sp.]
MSKARQEGDNGSIRLLQVTAFVSTLDRFAMPPMLLAIAHDLDVPLSAVVHAAGAYFLAYGLMQPVWGMVSDRWGLVRTMRLTLVAAATCTIAAAFAWDSLSLGVTRCLAGAFFGAAYPSLLIYLGDTVPPHLRQRQITRLMVGVALGTAIASVGAGAVADVSTWRMAFVSTGAAALVLAVVLGRLSSPSVSRTHATLLGPSLLVLHSRATLLVLALAFFEGVVLIGTLTLLPPAIEATGSSSTTAGSVTAVYGVAVLAAASLTGWLSRRHHPARLIAIGATSSVVACTVMAFSQLPRAAVLVAALLGLTWAAMHSSLQTWATEVLPAARATVVSFFAGSLFIGSAVAALAVAGLVEQGRYGVIFALAAAGTLPLGVLATWGRARWRPESATG